MEIKGIIFMRWQKTKLTCVNKNAIMCVNKNALGDFSYEDQYICEIGNGI